MSEKGEFGSNEKRNKGENRKKGVERNE